MQRYDHMELNFEGLHMQKWNISADRAQRLDGDICLVIMFTPRVTVIKMSKMARFFVFSANNTKIFVTVWTKYLNAPERFYWVISANGMGNRLWGYILLDIESRNNKKKYWVNKKYLNPVFLRVAIFLMVAQNPIIHSIF